MCICVCVWLCLQTYKNISSGEQRKQAARREDKQVLILNYRFMYNKWKKKKLNRIKQTTNTKDTKKGEQPTDDSQERFRHMAVCVWVLVGGLTAELWRRSIRSARKLTTSIEEIPLQLL